MGLHIILHVYDIVCLDLRTKDIDLTIHTIMYFSIALLAYMYVYYIIVQT